MMSVPTKPAKKPWIEKQWNRTKYCIANHRKYLFSQGKRDTRGTCVFVYEYKDKLTFHKLFWCIINGKIQTTTKERYSLVFRNNKFNFYKFVGLENGVNGVRNVSFSAGEHISRLISHIEKKIYIRRMLFVLKKFFKKCGVPNSVIKKTKNNINFLVNFCIYPACFDLFNNIGRFISPSRSCSGAFREQAFSDTIYKIFGNNGKKLKKGVFEAISDKKNRTDIFIFGPIFRGLVPVESFHNISQQLLKTKRYYYGGNIDQSTVKILRKILKHYPEQRIKILSEDVQNFGSFVQDTVRMFKEYGGQLVFPEKPKSLKEIHDAFARQLSRLREADFEIPIFKTLQPIDGVEYQEFRIEIPKSRYQLLDYGEKMSNCIGSYAREFKNGNCQLIGVYKNNQLTYNIEVRGKEIRQFHAKCNTPPDLKDKEIISEFLLKNNIINDWKRIHVDTIRAVPVPEIRGIQNADIVVDVPW